MADVHTKRIRSKNMAAIKSKGNKTTEKKFEYLLKNAGITGWRRNYKIIGTPDFVFPRKKLALFIDGCFWHGCRKCYISPKSNKKFWKNKIKDNINHDKRVNRQLKDSGWKVVRIKEHALKGQKVMQRRIVNLLNDICSKKSIS